MRLRSIGRPRKRPIAHKFGYDGNPPSRRGRKTPASAATPGNGRRPTCDGAVQGVLGRNGMIPSPAGALFDSGDRLFRARGPLVFQAPSTVRRGIPPAAPTGIGCLPVQACACKHPLTSFRTLCRTDTLVRQSAIDGQECPSYVFRFCSETCERVLKTFAGMGRMTWPTSLPILFPVKLGPPPSPPRAARPLSSSPARQGFAQGDWVRGQGSPPGGIAARVSGLPRWC